MKKKIESDVTVKRKALSTAKKKLKEVRRDKNKIDTSVLVDLENILAARNIFAAAYHSSKLKGIDCRELLSLCNTIFDFEIKPYLCSLQHQGRCTKDQITKACNLHRDILVTLDALT
jgi:hypothetical protein